MLKTKNILLMIFIIITMFSLFFLISAADYHDSIPVTTDGGGNIIIDPSCQEDWSGSTWGACVNSKQTFICFDKNDCHTYDLIPEQCGYTRECHYCGDGTCNSDETCSSCSDDCGACAPAPSGGSSGGGGGGGGGSGGGGSGTKTSTTGGSSVDLSSSTGQTCTESWVCDEWSDSKDECGVRTCTDSNNCGTIELKPETERECSLTAKFFGITGAVIGFVKSPSGIGLIVAVVLIVAGLGVMGLRKKQASKTNEIQTENKE